jgi:hypothetical protein
VQPGTRRARVQARRSTTVVSSDFADTTLFFCSLFTDPDHPSVCTARCIYTPLSSSSRRASVSNTLSQPPFAILVCASSNSRFRFRRLHRSPCPALLSRPRSCRSSVIACALPSTCSHLSFLSLPNSPFFRITQSLTSIFEAPTYTMHSACEIEVSL